MSVCPQMVLLTHGDSIGRLADCLEETARSGELVAAVQHKSRRAYGVQFHPEVELSENGLTMLRSFLYEVGRGCGFAVLRIDVCVCVCLYM